MKAPPLCLPRTQEAWNAMGHLMRSYLLQQVANKITHFSIHDDPHDDSKASFDISYQRNTDGGIQDIRGTLESHWANVPVDANWKDNRLGDGEDDGLEAYLVTYVMVTVLNPQTGMRPQWRIFLDGSSLSDL